MALCVEFEWQHEDYLASVEYQTRREWSTATTRRFHHFLGAMIGLAVVAGVATVAGLSLLWGEEQILGGIIAACSATLCYVMIHTFQGNRQNAKIRQTVAEYAAAVPATDPAFGWRRLTIDDEGVHMESHTQSRRVRWAAIVSVVETHDHMMFDFRSRTEGMEALPKRALATAERADEFLSFARQRIGDRASAVPAPSRE